MCGTPWAVRTISTWRQSSGGTGAGANAGRSVPVARMMAKSASGRRVMPCEYRMRPDMRSSMLAAVLVVATVALTVTAAATPQQRRGPRLFGFDGLSNSAAPIKYDGQFVIVRLWYPSYPGWSYDYPDMEQ